MSILAVESICQCNTKRRLRKASRSWRCLFIGDRVFLNREGRSRFYGCFISGDRNSLHFLRIFTVTQESTE
jgi:hypothetical protein